MAAEVELQYHVLTTFTNGWPSGSAGLLVWWLTRLRSSSRFGTRHGDPGCFRFISDVRSSASLHVRGSTSGLASRVQLRPVRRSRTSSPATSKRGVGHGTPRRSSASCPLPPHG